mgnify:CR=1 FL=1
MKNDPQEFDEKRHDEQWRNEIAHELNILRVRTDFIASDPYYAHPQHGCDVDIEFVAAARSIIQRVAEFDDIKTIARLDDENQGLCPPPLRKRKVRAS